MSGILYVIVAILVILVVILTAALRRAVRIELEACQRFEWEIDSREKTTISLRAYARRLYADWLEADKQIAKIRQKTEGEMRELFKAEVNSLYAEINLLWKEKSELIRTVNLQAYQLEKLDRATKSGSVQLEFNELKELAEKSEPSGISINGVPMSHAELAEAQSNNDQSEYPIGPYGLHELSDLEAWDYLYETEVPSHKKGLWRGEEKLHNKVDNTRQSPYRQVTIDLRKARKLVELQRLENENT